MHVAASGVEVKWCEGFMFEQSPFSIADFAKQRCRWYAGLWLCVRSPNLLLWRRCFLGAHVFSWSLCPLLNILNWVNILVAFERSLLLRVTVTSLYVAPCWGYVLGFWLTFKPAQLQHGVAEWLLLLYLQIVGIPLFAAMEAYGILLAFMPGLQKCAKLCSGPGAAGQASAYASFAIVKKEGADAKRRAAEMDGLAELPAAMGSVEDPEDATTSTGDGPAAKAPSGDDKDRYWRERLCNAPPALQLPLVEPLLPSGTEDRALQRWLPLPASLEAAVSSTASTLSDSDGAVSPLAVGTALLAWISAVHARTDDVCICVISKDDSVTLVRLFVNTEANAPEADAPASPDSPVYPSLSKQTTLASLALDVERQLVEGAANKLPPAALVMHGPSVWAADPTAAISMAVSSQLEPKLPPPFARMLLMLSLPAAGPHTSPGHARLYFDDSRLPETGAVRLAARLERGICTPSVHTPLWETPLFTDGEAHRVTVECNQTAAGPLVAATIHEAIEAVAAQHPDAVALSSHRGEPLQTYATLSASSASLARALRMLAGEDFSLQRRLVGLLFERSSAMVVAILGTLRAGGGYMPIDPSFPMQRIDAMFAEANPAAVLVGVPERALGERLQPDLTCAIASVSADGCLQPIGPVSSASAQPHDTLPMLPCSRDDLVYVMYTSGTTGRPKGVCVAHGPLLCRTAWMGRAYPIGVGDTVSFKTQFIFGISEWELFYTLSHTATLSIIPQKVVQAPTALARSLVDHRAAVVFLIPSHLDALLPHLPQPFGRLGCGRTRLTLRHIVCCGEALRPETVARMHSRLHGRVQLHNLYGPTEGSMTWEKCEDAQPREVLIGRSIDDTVVVLLDVHLRAVPIGVPGEVCFGGAIADGYLAQPELTAAKFIANPFAGAMRADPRLPAADVLYRSGDLAVRLPSGNLRFLGRIDRQVKLRGYRIELEAIEAVARSRWAHSEAAMVQLAATVVGGTELALYVTHAAMDVGTGKGAPRLLDHCAEMLPAYMRPSVVLALTEFPKLPNGKINLPALTEPATRSTAVVVEEATPTTAAAGSTLARVRDSLGMVRELNTGSGAASAAREAAIADALRAFFMYGVIMDHFAGCADGSTCRFVVEEIVWRQPLAAQGGLMWLDTTTRMIGGYKCMAGFIMISAYIDSGYVGSSYWGKGDLVTFVSYLQMIWVLDPLVYALCSATMPDRCSADSFYFAGVHRWYLLAMLIIKAMLAAMRVARLPACGQCVLVTIMAFLLPPELGCLTEARCESSSANDVDAWRGSLQCDERDPDYCVRAEDGLRTTLAPFWALLFQGPYADTWSMFSSIAMRYYFVRPGAQH